MPVPHPFNPTIRGRLTGSRAAFLEGEFAVAPAINISTTFGCIVVFCHRLNLVSEAKVLLSPGEKLGPYKILAPIGTGGMGVLYKALDLRLDRVVALKISKEEFTERFEREAKAVAALNHPHICQLYDIGTNYLVFEFIDGTPLKGPLPAENVRRYATEILEALQHADQRGVIHRDLKPANLQLTSAGVKVLDFGIAKLAAATSPGNETSTMGPTVPGQIIGTPALHVT